MNEVTVEQALAMVKERTEAWKSTAELFLHNNVSVFVKDINGNIYFGDILLVGEDTLMIECFGPPKRLGRKETIYWSLVAELEQYNSGGDT